MKPEEQHHVAVPYSSFEIPVVFDQEAPCFHFCWNSRACPLMINTVLFSSFLMTSILSFHKPEAANFLTFSEACHAVSLPLLSHILYFLLWTPSLSTASSAWKAPLHPSNTCAIILSLMGPLLSLWKTKWTILNWLFVCLSYSSVAVQMAWTATYILRTWH